MFNRRWSIVFAMLLCAGLFGVRAEEDLDRIFTPQRSFYSATGKGIGGASVALPWSMASALANPALLYSCRNGSAPVYRSLYIGYARDSLFDRYVLPIGLSYSRKRTAIAGHARLLSSGFGLTGQEAGFTFCRRVFRNADRRGPLDMGVNIRYDRALWETRYHDTLFTIRSYVDSLGRKRRVDEVVAMNAPPERGFFREHRIMADIGLFKPEFASHLDCGITVKNMVAWSAGSERPLIVRRLDTTGVQGDTLFMVDRVEEYDDSYHRYGRWVAGRYAVIVLGWNLKIGNPAGRFSLSVPFEVGMHGLFDRNMTDFYAIHTGLQVHILKDIFVRVGFERSPGPLSGGSGRLRPVHNIGFGTSLLPPGLPVVIDCYFTHQEWGVSLSTDL
jgi:hypothetical protein